MHGRSVRTWEMLAVWTRRTLQNAALPFLLRDHIPVNMKFLKVLLAAGQLLAATAQQWPLHNDGMNDVVQWDHYSLIVNGERLFFWSGEFHYWRIPVPE